MFWFDIAVAQCSARWLSKLPSPGEERRGSRLECVWYSICQCVKQVGLGETAEKDRESIKRVAVCSAAFARKRLDPGFKQLFNKLES
jgi:hypothetical protein